MCSDECSIALCSGPAGGWSEKRNQDEAPLAIIVNSSSRLTNVTKNHFSLPCLVSAELWFLSQRKHRPFGPVFLLVFPSSLGLSCQSRVFNIHSWLSLDFYVDFYRANSNFFLIRASTKRTKLLR